MRAPTASDFPRADLWAVIQQRPVGQGGLCVGALSSRHHTLNWVYDCGSNQSDVLTAEIARVPQTLDFLFVSHLDDDHVSGLDRLLSGRTVKEAVLPYLTDEVRLLVAADALSRNRFTGALSDFLGDAAGWLRNRGVERMTFVSWPEEGGGEGGPDLPDVSTPGDGPLHAKWQSSSDSKIPGISHAPPGAALVVVSEAAAAGRGGGPIDYLFLPHVHPPRPALMQAFRAELTRRFPGKTSRDIADMVRPDQGQIDHEQINKVLTDLRACYDELWSDHNLISMSLYAGPTGAGKPWRATGSERCWWEHEHTFLGWHDMSPGWISTGDASFEAKTRRRSFNRAYSKVGHQVGVLVTPHHGAASSWHADILTTMSMLDVGLAAAGKNGYGHPHDLVRDDILRHGARFHQVSEAADSAYVLSAWTPV